MTKEFWYRCAAFTSLSLSPKTIATCVVTTVEFGCSDDHRPFSAKSAAMRRVVMRTYTPSGCFPNWRVHIQKTTTTKFELNRFSDIYIKRPHSSSQIDLNKPLHWVGFVLMTRTFSVVNLTVWAWRKLNSFSWCLVDAVVPLFRPPFCALPYKYKTDTTTPTSSRQSAKKICFKVTSSLLPRQTTGYLFSLTHPLTIYRHLLSVPFSGSFLDSPSTQIFTVEMLQHPSPDLLLVKKFRSCSHSLCSTSLFQITSSSDDAVPYLYTETTVATSMAAETLGCSVTSHSTFGLVRYLSTHPEI